MIVYLFIIPQGKPPKFRKTWKHVNYVTRIKFKNIYKHGAINKLNVSSVTVKSVQIYNSVTNLAARTLASLRLIYEPLGTCNRPRISPDKYFSKVTI